MAPPNLAVLRFFQSGPQTLRLYCDEPLMRVDTIWLSTTQTIDWTPLRESGSVREQVSP